jgi:hypothetical protein
MDYIDDLDQAAMDALNELYDGFSSLDVAPEAELSSEMDALIRSTKKQNTELLSKSLHKSSIMNYLFRLNSPITASLLSSAAILPSQPEIIQGKSEDGSAQFCLIPSSSLPNLKAWLSSTYPSFKPTFTPINRACKALSPYSAYPSLGLDTTLPHNRPHDTVDGGFRPKQHEYPVWYFFYGTLANPDFLAQLFGSPPGTKLVLVPAHIEGGKLRTWGGKYKALVDCSGRRVDGWVFEVESEEQEEVLCMYETAKYEVVRVRIEVEERGVVWGCTFRFTGQAEDLD